jgi:cysteine dioxygenase
MPTSKLKKLHLAMSRPLSMPTTHAKVFSSMKSASLTQFLDVLGNLDAKGFKGNAIDSFMAEYFIPQEEFLPYIYFREDTYGRNLVAKNDFFELLVLTWLPNQRTKIHDHAGERCWMTVQLGELTMKNYHAPKNGSNELVSMGATETCKEGRAVYIDDGIGIHSITNCSRKPAVSVHLYAAPISRCKTYNESLKKFEYTELYYFTQYGQGLQDSQPDLR